jgi:hypothetical protein
MAYPDSMSRLEWAPGKKAAVTIHFTHLKGNHPPSYSILLAGKIGTSVTYLHIKFIFLLFFEDGLTFYAADDNMLQCTRGVYARFAGHSFWISDTNANVKWVTILLHFAFCNPRFVTIKLKGK